MLPKISFLEDVSACQIAMLPDKFYDRVEEGSIIIKNSQILSFCEEGLIIDGENQPIETDVVIFATGFKGDEKLRNIFESPVFQNNIMGSPTSTVSLYRSFVNFLFLAIYLSIRSLSFSMNASSLIFHG
jgi:dimethylaniline monooxygenase (N-oxide forming)